MSDESQLRPEDIIECLIFAAEHPLTLDQIAKILDLTPSETRSRLETLTQRHQERGGLRIVEVAGGYQMVTAPVFAPYIEKLRKVRRVRLSRAALETLSIIAYRQPVTRPEIDHVRGVSSDGSLATLIDRGLVETSGRKPVPGRPWLFRTTEEFLDHFGLKGLGDLPPLEEVEEKRIAELLREQEETEQAEAEQSGESGGDAQD